MDQPFPPVSTTTGVEQIGPDCSDTNTPVPAHDDPGRPERPADCAQDTAEDECVRPDHAQPPRLVVRIGQQTFALGDDQLQNPILYEELQDEVRRADGTVDFTFTDMLALPDDARRRLLSLLATNQGRCRVQLGECAAQHEDVFAAVLEAIKGGEDLSRTHKAVEVALETAVLFIPDQLDLACRQIVDRCKELGIKGISVPHMISQARQLAGKDGKAPQISAAEAADAFVKFVRLNARLPEGEAALRYYQEDFHAYQDGRWGKIAAEELKAQLTRFLQRLGCAGALTTRFVQDVVTNLKGMCLLDCWDEHMPFLVERESPVCISRPQFVSFDNGMIDLEEAGEGAMPARREHDPRYFSSVRLPFGYDPGADCPLWLRTLAEIFPPTGDQDHRVEVLQEFMGWTLFAGDTRFQKFLILVGRGSNGKSTLLSVWEELLGRDNVAHVPLEGLSGEFRLHETAGKLANIAGDMNHLDQVAEGVLKQLTSGDPIQVNRKYRAPTTLRPTARLVFATNGLPSITDRSDGVWRRMIVLPFLRQFRADEVDTRRVEKLRSELPGIFNWALAGGVRLFRRNGFSACGVCQTSAEEHRLGCDPFRQFVDEQCLRAPEMVVRKEELYAAYRQFCLDNGRQPKNSAEFGKWVVALPGVSVGREGAPPRKWFYTGVGLWSEAARPRYSPLVPGQQGGPAGVLTQMLRRQPMGPSLARPNAPPDRQEGSSRP